MQRPYGKVSVVYVTYLSKQKHFTQMYVQLSNAQFHGDLCSETQRQTDATVVALPSQR